MTDQNNSMVQRPPIPMNAMTIHVGSNKAKEDKFSEPDAVN